jgi:hypothetical protein
MPKLRDAIVFAYGCNIINDAEYALLYDAGKPKNPDIPYFAYNDFNLDNMTDNECKTEFRFYRNDIYNLIDVFRVPAEFTYYNGLKVDAVETMCIFLKRFAYPCRYAD